MVLKNLPVLVILIAILGLGFYWLVNRPTPEERVLRDFFDDFRMGRYTQAEEFSVDNDFYSMAASTMIHDADNEEYLVGDYFPPNRAGALQVAIESWVRPYISRWKYLSMDTERLTDNESIVTFRIDIGIREFSGGQVFSPDIHSATVEGQAYMDLESEGWAIDYFDMHLFSEDGMTLEPYLEQVN